jgi:hypothetical protein
VVSKSADLNELTAWKDHKMDPRWCSPVSAARCASQLARVISHPGQ